jgi:hypothetical protein
MKIAIIGGGWVGCHLSLKLKNDHDVTLFDKNEELFCETSYKNQNRLHYGFHYARNHKTRLMCKDTFDSFINEYGFLTKELKKNLYCVPNKESIIDYETYKQIFNGFYKKESNIRIQNTDGCIKTNERYIDFKKSKLFFNNQLKDIFIQKEIKFNDLKSLSNEYDLVINSTNNFIKDNNRKDSFYELTISLIYEKIGEPPFDALTLVDGELFSLYPYSNDRFTLTDVKHTPIKKFKTINSLNSFMKKIDVGFVNDRKKIIEKKVKKYYPNFDSVFKYDTYFLSTKSKIINNSDERYPVITKNENIINCFTGKIQGIYIIENYIKNEIIIR